MREKHILIRCLCTPLFLLYVLRSFLLFCLCLNKFAVILGALCTFSVLNNILDLNRAMLIFIVLIFGGSSVSCLLLNTFLLRNEEILFC